MISFKSVPGTQLEVGSHGRSHNRIVFVRRRGADRPLAVANDARIVLVGNPERRIVNAMRAGLFSRPIVSDILGAPISGGTYHKLRRYVNGR